MFTKKYQELFTKFGEEHSIALMLIFFFSFSFSMLAVIIPFMYIHGLFRDDADVFLLMLGLAYGTAYLTMAPISAFVIRKFWNFEE